MKDVSSLEYIYRLLKVKHKLCNMGRLKMGLKKNVYKRIQGQSTKNFYLTENTKTFILYWVYHIMIGIASWKIKTNLSN